MMFTSYATMLVRLLVLMSLMSAVFCYRSDTKSASKVFPQKVAVRSTRRRGHESQPRAYNWHNRRFFDDFVKEMVDADWLGSGSSGSSGNMMKPVVMPYSGELIRLRGYGKFLNFGLVEVYKNGQWGYICADSWDVEDANVTCKQLGFTMGAISKQVPNKPLPQVERSSAKFLLAEVNCLGTESSVQMCPHSNWNKCTTNAAASVTCKANEGCPKEWVAGFGKCYKFFSKANTINMAAKVCARENASLVTIESSAENNFLSGVIKNSLSYIKHWYTSGMKSTNGWEWNKIVIHQDANISRSRNRNKLTRPDLVTAKSVLDMGRWFPGWPLNTNKYAEPANMKLYDCLTLSSEFDGPNGGTLVVDYFYWKANKCRRNEGINFICQLDGEVKKDLAHPDCYDDDGSNYRGTAAVSEKGNPCVNWAVSTEVNEMTHPENGLGDHNYCRNPDSDVRPWCWVSKEGNKFGYCKLPRCSELDTPALDTTTTGTTTTGTTTTGTTTTRTTTRTTTTTTRTTTTSTSECYDGNGSNYRGSAAVSEKGNLCVNWDVSTEVNEMTHPGKGLGDHNYCRNPDNDVRPWCWVSKEGNKFGYCKLSRCSELDTPALDTTTTTMTTTSAPELIVMLVGEEVNSGTVEITYKGEKGLICDDKWTLEDATVICRMLGYSHASRETELNFFNYPLKDIKFILDDVHCFGNETSIKDCAKSLWNTHDCEAYEIAGVICQIDKECEADHFKCRNSRCVKIFKVCNKKDDCGDNSDEHDCGSVNIRLVNGSVPWEGRVQVLRNKVSGSVCDDRWDNKDASVVCKILGYMEGGIAVNEGYFGSENGPIWLDNVQCIGTETSLESCTHGGWAKHDCSHKEDAGVKCFNNNPHPNITIAGPSLSIREDHEESADPQEIQLKFEIKLQGGRDDSEGNVEVIINNVNYHVCDNMWDENDATVICKILGYRAPAVATTKSFFGTDQAEVIFNNVQCLGNETDFTQCIAVVGVKNINCSSNNLAGVICSKSSLPLQTNRTNLEAHPNIKCGKRPYDYEDVMNRQLKNRIKRSNAENDDYINDMYKLKELNQQDQKIIGGHYAVHGAYPWQVRVHLILSLTPDGAAYGLHHCGAVIISEYWLLSAGHCFFKNRPSDFRIIVGDFHLKTKDIGEEVFSVDKIILHEDYDDETKNNDIALIKIQPKDEGRGIIFNNYVQPACLPDPASPFVEGVKCMISGWGNVKLNLDDNNETSEYPQTMKSVEVPLINQKTCQYLHTKRINGFLSDGMFCAGFIKGGIDSCDGDSGGPLVCKTDGIYTIVGITSWGRGCAIPDLPGVYTRVSYYLPWIESTIKKHSKVAAESHIPSNP